MTGVGSRISRANLPSMYWQQHKIKHEALKWYNLNWGRLETYAHTVTFATNTWARYVLSKAQKYVGHAVMTMGFIRNESNSNTSKH